MPLSLLSAVFSVAFGLILGSFLNVCIHRIPLGRSIVHPPSSCPECGVRIRFYDNIPLVSYLFLRGRCRSCGAWISWRYPLVEALTGAISYLLFIRFGLGLQYIVLIAFSASLVVISIIDLYHQIIPDVISLPGILAGIGASFLIEDLSWTASLLGAVAGGGSLFLVGRAYAATMKREGIGDGDIKLLAMIGAWMGWSALPLVVLISSLVGALVGGAFLVMSGQDARTRIPFGPFLSLGSLFYLFWGRQLIQWYLSLVK